MESGSVGSLFRVTVAQEADLTLGVSFQLGQKPGSTPSGRRTLPKEASGAVQKAGQAPGDSFTLGLGALPPPTV